MPVLEAPLVAALCAVALLGGLFLAWRLSPPGRALGLAVVACCGCAFGVITGDVLAQERLAGADGPLADWLTANRSEGLTAVMQVTTNLGSAWAALPLALVAAVIVPAPEHRRRAAVTALVAVAGIIALVNAIKLVVGRARPDLALVLVETDSASFPSGHAAQSAAACAAIAHLVAAHRPERALRITAWPVAAAVVLVVGYSRLYLGAHWLTDVLGGYALGTAWTAAVITALHRPPRVTAARFGAPAPEGRAGPL
ncbi:phosphatase PAP2 family protein [Saccharopolyspora taberi]|uniref:Phosphatidic acid phosphatase type 2/haloperoxidase domain-containing protein n=1 Tax=Saccharopolyspora taberi TaxID=60895 RepID=A0ABN3V9P5_9PSEU